MPILTKQIVLKVSPELEILIDQAFSAHLKKTGEYISRADYMRRILQEHCSLELVAQQSTNVEQGADHGKKTR